MAKSNLISILNSVQGKLVKGENLCFRRTAKGGSSIYVQAEHSYGSLHSPAQERHRALLAGASMSASQVLADVALREVYEAQWKASDGRYRSLQRYVVHLEYEGIKGEDAR